MTNTESGTAETGRRGDRRPPGLDRDERTTLLSFLDYLRESVIAKASGLSDEEAGRPVVASGTSLLWLVKHLTAVELNWFVWSYTGLDAEPWDDDAPLSGDESAEQLIADYRAAVARANAVITACTVLDRPGARSLRETAPPSMRWLLVHMVEETARHAGHADILREQLDGSVGR